MNWPIERFFSLPKPSVMALVLAIGSFDYITGRDFALSPYYLVPISWVTWTMGRRAGIWLALASTLTWFISEGASRSPEEGADTAIWLATLPESGPSGGIFRDRQAVDW